VILASDGGHYLSRSAVEALGPKAALTWCEFCWMLGDGKFGWTREFSSGKRKIFGSC
jgi:hypothetical protein